MQYQNALITEILGKTLLSVEVDSDQIFFHTNDGTYLMHHTQACCEDVWLEGDEAEIAEDLRHMVGETILQAEVDTHWDEDTESQNRMWTFYKFATLSSSTTLRWVGESDYYSVEVDFHRVVS